MGHWTIHPDETPPKATLALADQVERDGGHALAIYREPVGDHWHIFCVLPLARVEPTPYQRDLSPTRQAAAGGRQKIDRFVDPVVVMSPRPGVYWTLNSSHRRAVAPPEGQDHPRHPRARARGGAESGAQHREGPQPQGKSSR
jgi:hypothetical protein